VEHELVAREGAMQAGFDPLPLDRPCVHRPLEELKIIPAGLLGVVHRGVRARDEGVRILPVVWVDADPDGHGEMQLVVRDVVRRDQCGDDLPRAGGCVVRMVDLRQ
jgi:hypothetical protein